MKFYKNKLNLLLLSIAAFTSCTKLNEGLGNTNLIAYNPSSGQGISHGLVSSDIQRYEYYQCNVWARSAVFSGRKYV